MHEPERWLGAQDVDAGERESRFGGGLVLEVSERGRLSRVGIVAQDRHGPRQLRRVRWEAGQAQRHGARAGPSPELAEAGHLRLGRGEIIGNDRVHELAQEQRVAAGLLVAGGAESIVGLGQGLAQELGGGLRAQRSRLDDRRQRVQDDLAKEASVSSRLAGPETDDHPDIESLDPRQEVGQPAQGRKVAPVQVVDRQQQPPVGGHVRRQPVKAVHRRQRRVGGRLGCELGGIKERGRERRRAHIQLGALVRRKGGQERLEQLPHDAVREGALKLRAAPAQDVHPGRLAQRLRLGDEGSLADAGRTFEREEMEAGLGRGYQAFDRRTLDIALEQFDVSRQRLPWHLRAALLARLHLIGLP